MADFTDIVMWRLHLAPEPEEHPDANLLSGFAERSLSGKDRLQVLEHLAQCAHCREIVSLAVPPTVAAESTVLVPRHAPAWLRWPVLRWGAVAACLVIVGTAVTLRLEQRKPTKPVSEVGQTSPDAANLQQKATPSASAIADLGRAASQPTQLHPLRKSPKAKPVVSADQDQDQDQEELAHGGDRNGGGEPTLMADSTSPAGDVPGRAKEAVATPSGAGAGDVPAAQFGSAAQYQSSVPRWTLSSDGVLQRSLDSGRTWQQIQVSSSATLRALAAIGQDIWVGGAAGALYHSADAGENWVQVQPVADGESLTADVLGVEFTDALHGRITVSGQKTWSTADAGQTWEKK